MPFPDFFLFGPPSYSKSLIWSWLSQSRDVFLPARREMGIYALPDLAKSLDMSTDPRLVDVVYTKEAYDRSYRPCGQRLTGDASTLYSLVPEAVRRIYKDRPDSKFLIMLEDPINRGWEAHAYNCRIGVETVSDFNVALDLENERLERGESPYFGYARGSRYRQIIEPLDILFGAENVKIVIAERAFEFPEDAMEDICSFLGISSIPVRPEGIAGWRARQYGPGIAAQRDRWRQQNTNSSFFHECSVEATWVEGRVRTRDPFWSTFLLRQ